LGTWKTVMGAFTLTFWPTKAGAAIEATTRMAACGGDVWVRRLLGWLSLHGCRLETRRVDTGSQL
jgi:hypothetical protein